MLPTVRHMKYGRIRGMVVGEGGRSSGVLLYYYYYCYYYYLKIDDKLVKCYDVMG